MHSKPVGLSKKFFAFVLSLLMVTSSIPNAAFGEAASELEPDATTSAAQSDESGPAATSDAAANDQQATPEATTPTATSDTATMDDGMAASAAAPSTEVDASTKGSSSPTEGATATQDSEAAAQDDATTSDEGSEAVVSSQSASGPVDAMVAPIRSRLRTSARKTAS